MGLGKTGLALNDFIEHSDLELCIVVSPQSFKLDWLVAVEDYDLGFLRTGYWPKHPPPTDWESGLYAINYEGVSRSRATKPLLELLDRRRVLLIIDESKALGNPRSGWTRAVLNLAKRATMVRLLNGTPVTQSPLDLYGQLRALGQLYGMTAVEFRNRFCVMGGFMGKQILPNTRNADQLAKILDGCSFRALKSDWRKDLPPKVYSTIHLELTSQQQQHYRSMVEEFYVLVADEDVTADMIITQMVKLQQISSGFILKDERALMLGDPKHNPKLKAAVELCSGPGKTIIVYYFKASGQLLFEALTKAGLAPAHIQGGMKPVDLIETKRRFNDDTDCRVILGQERAVALGHTLLGQPGHDRCSRTIFYENSYSLYYRSQAEDRAHRSDQDERLTIYDFVASPIEQAAIDILQAKREMAAALDNVVMAVRKAQLNL